MAGDSSPNPNPKPNTSSGTKRKRSLPGNPDPEADVIALSPATLLAAATFVCEVCGKEFRRDQNLQIHRRGHNIPWKFSSKQPTRIAGGAATGDGGSSKEVKKRVYVCPVEGCVYHEPSRALGDLTGIKKHYSRKHGEKKWECERCLKKYAVKTDWKAHSRVCGSREYECACGTLFSRKESFATHRASCVAKAEGSDGGGGELATGAAMAMVGFRGNNTELLFPSLWGQASGGDKDERGVERHRDDRSHSDDNQ